MSETAEIIDCMPTISGKVQHFFDSYPEARVCRVSWRLPEGYDTGGLLRSVQVSRSSFPGTPETRWQREVEARKKWPLSVTVSAEKVKPRQDGAAPAAPPLEPGEALSVEAVKGGNAVAIATLTGAVRLALSREAQDHSAALRLLSTAEERERRAEERARSAEERERRLLREIGECQASLKAAEVQIAMGGGPLERAAAKAVEDPTYAAGLLSAGTTLARSLRPPPPPSSSAPALAPAPSPLPKGTAGPLSILRDYSAGGIDAAAAARGLISIAELLIDTVPGEKRLPLALALWGALPPEVHTSLKNLATG
jgi:hypothetical protein